LHFHYGDNTWVREFVQSAFSDEVPPIRIESWEDFEPGCAILVELNKSIERSWATVLVISDEFNADPWCRQAVVRACTNRPERVVPVVRTDALTASEMHAEWLQDLLHCHHPIYFNAATDDVVSFQQELRRRVDILIGW
jgi:hypothetical protein